MEMPQEIRSSLGLGHATGVRRVGCKVLADSGELFGSSAKCGQEFGFTSWGLGVLN